jgi:hypothetical protein
MTYQEILARIFLAVRALYKKDGGALPDAVLNVTWNYTNPASPDLGEVLKEINGKALVDIPDQGQDEDDRTAVSSSTFGQLGRRLDRARLAALRCLDGGGRNATGRSTAITG